MWPSQSPRSHYYSSSGLLLESEVVCHYYRDGFSQQVIRMQNTWPAASHLTKNWNCRFGRVSGLSQRLPIPQPGIVMWGLGTNTAALGLPPALHVQVVTCTYSGCQRLQIKHPFHQWTRAGNLTPYTAALV